MGEVNILSKEELRKLVGSKGVCKSTDRESCNNEGSCTVPGPNGYKGTCGWTAKEGETAWCSCGGVSPNAYNY